MATDFQQRARRLRNAVEPVAAGVYFAPEAHSAYTALGFAGSPPVSPDGIARPELKSYFTSRSACMGHVHGEVVAAAFGCFNPKVVTRRRTPRAAVITRTGSRLNLLTVAGFACLGPAGLFALYGLDLIVPQFH